MGKEIFDPAGLLKPLPEMQKILDVQMPSIISLMKGEGLTVKAYSINMNQSNMRRHGHIMMHLSEVVTTETALKYGIAQSHDSFILSFKI